jgi:4-amino-4-deoxy-L-arabinose transferase-like glycosyltransferase
MVSTPIRPWLGITVVVLILILAAFSRLYRIGDYMTFLGDEGRDALVVRDIVLGRHFPLIGPGTSVGSMYLGPLYYYLIAPSLFLANYSPVGPSVFVALLGVATVGLLWWISQDWFGFIPASIISLLYAISPTTIIYSHSSWNPNVMPFFALVTMYSLYLVWQKHNWRWLIVTAISFAFVLNSHYLGLLLLPAIVLFLLFSHKSPNFKFQILFSVFSFLILMSPLLLFDLRHNWANISALRTFFTNRETTVNLKAYKAIPTVWPIWQDINTTLLAANQKNIGMIISVIFVAVGLIELFRQLTSREFNRQFIFIITWVGIGIIGLGLYKQHIYPHYFGFLFPAVFLLLGYFIFRLSHTNLLLKLLLGLCLSVITLNLIHYHPLNQSPNHQLFLTQKISEFILQKSSYQPFNLALLSKSNYDAGYRYFFPLTNNPYRTIHEQITDQLFVVCELGSRPDCEPINNPLWEIASFGWSKIDTEWEISGGVRVFRLIHNPSGS